MEKKVLFSSLTFIIASFCFGEIENSEAAYLPPGASEKVAVVSAHQLATEAGLQILKQGGNAVDAAVAIGYALAVVHPCCGNIGGGGFMLIHLANGKNTIIDFREAAPAAIKSQLFLDANGQVNRQLAESSYLSVGVPGTVLGLNTALQKYGTLSLTKVMQPAIQLAEQGFILNNDDLQILGSKKSTEIFQKQKNVEQIFLKNGQPFQAGDRLVQPQLAATLKLISQQGSKAFYQGEIADKIVAASATNHGVLAKSDFAEYQVFERVPITCFYRGYKVVTTPPPSSGVTVCGILNVLNQFPINDWGYHSAASVHYNIEAMRYAFADRNQELGDPAFVNNPLEHLLSADYAKQIAQKIQPDRAGDSASLVQSPQTEGVNTTHYNIIDRQGNAVAATYTVNDYFGAKIIAGDTGFFLNDDMDDFALSANTKNMFGLQQGKSNLVAPGKRPLSSMTPTMVFNNNQLFMILGAAGGPTIITSIIQTIENVIDYGMDINAAINEPRFHFQWMPTDISLEPYALSADTLQKLTAMGYKFHSGSIFNTVYWGQELGILKDPNSKTLYSATDNRHAGGSSLGY